MALVRAALKEAYLKVIPLEEVFQVDPQLISNTEADLWDPGGNAKDIFDVEFLVVSVDTSTTAWASVGQDIAGGGSIGTAEFFMRQESIPPRASSGWRGPFRIGGDDHIRGVAQAANDLVIHFRIKRVKDAQ